MDKFQGSGVAAESFNGQLRILPDLNKSICRNKKKLSTIELATSFHGAKVFTKLDI